ncbi:hypothetical protein POSPLADRAFT_1037753 [Postia placenta MAD-698-R-SB12]|uniref:Pyridoxamine 5'-phosphate oxidase Alr4036 family FMN-binding domain-containing protein n=1 Tax=Postia placenta MAD-698-R-SB12 TaxID=670580 RepID=A0A1X6NEP9_9APHY|nr:hypothetical protein POSPLADRAFT_1037753 [Postia placenta MAD-698-R-SB12]OSX66853.1 hypothetical protein POSPLADRAFT_1037753 [Postia placenta MAD-698-R-SB12]
MVAAPNWLNALSLALALPENKSQRLYQLATVDSKGLPHARTVGYVDFLEPEDSPNLPILLGMTDIRTPKVGQMRSQPYVEICWWLSGSREQFRIAGPLQVVASPNVDVDVVPKGEGTLAIDKLTRQGFDWETKRQETFERIPGPMKATWCKPQPASVIGSYDEGKTWPQTLAPAGEEQSEEEKQNRETALKNFALTLIEPVEVDWVQVGTNPHRRTKFTRNGEEWSEEILVP